MKLWKGLGALLGIVAVVQAAVGRDYAQYVPTWSPQISTVPNKVRFIVSDFLYRISLGAINFKVIDPSGQPVFLTNTKTGPILPGINFTKMLNNWTWAGLAGAGYWAARRFLGIPLPHAAKIGAIAFPVLAGGIIGGGVDPPGATTTTSYTRPLSTSLPIAAPQLTGSVAGQYGPGRAGLQP